MVMPATGFTKSLDTLDIIARTQSCRHCYHYRVKGVCVWGTIKNGMPRVTETLRVSHYLPDVVVSVFPEKNPWTEAEHAFQRPAKSVANKLGYGPLGSGHSESREAGIANIRFKEATVIGHPSNLVLANIPGMDLLPSQAKPWVPYYISISDTLLWRNAEPEMLAYPEKLIPGAKEVGEGLKWSWGPLYPRTGFVMHENDAKASGVIALRAAHLASTSHRIPHISVNLTNNSCGKKCKGPGAIFNNDDALFQMIYPKKEKRAHKLVSDIDEEWAKELSDDEAYVWVVWRKYEGCKDGKGKFLYSI